MYSRNYSSGHAILDVSGLSNSTYRSYGVGSSYGGHSGMVTNPSLNRIMNTDYGLSDSLSSRNGGPSYESGHLSPLRATPYVSGSYGDNSASRHRQYQTSSQTNAESLISTLPSSPTSRRKHVPESRWSPSSRVTNGNYFDFSSQAVMSYTPLKSTYRRTDYSDYLHPLLQSRPVLRSNYTPRSRAEREKTSTPLTRDRKLIKFRESSDVVANVKRRISWILSDDMDSSLTNELKEKDEESLLNRSRDSSLTKPPSRGGSPRKSFKRFSRDDSLTRMNDSTRNTNIFSQNRSPSPATRLPIGSPRGQSRSRSRENSLNGVDFLPSQRNLSAALLSRDKMRKNSLEGKPPRRKSSCDSLKSSQDILSEIQANNLKSQDSGVLLTADRSSFDNKAEVTETSKSQYPERPYRTRRSIEDILPELSVNSSLGDAVNKDNSLIGQGKLSGRRRNRSPASSELGHHGGIPSSRDRKRSSIIEDTDMISSKVHSAYTYERRESTSIINEVKPHRHRKSMKLKSCNSSLTEDSIHAPPFGPKPAKTERPSSVFEKDVPISLDKTKINSDLEKTEPFLIKKPTYENSQVTQNQLNHSNVETNLNHNILPKKEITKGFRQVPEADSVRKIQSMLPEKPKGFKDMQTKGDSKTSQLNLSSSPHQTSNVLSSKYLNKNEESESTISSITEKDLTPHKSDLKFNVDNRVAARTSPSSNAVNLSKTRINDHEINDLKMFQLDQSKENTSNLKEPLKSSVDLRTGVNETKPTFKCTPVQNNSKTELSNSCLTTLSAIPPCEKSVAKGIEVANSKSITVKTNAKHPPPNANFLKISEKTVSSQSKIAISPTTKDPLDKTSHKFVKADLKEIVDQKVSKPKDSTACQPQQLKPPVPILTPVSPAPNEEIVVVCKLPQPKWIKQTKNSTFSLPNHVVSSRGLLKSPSVKQVAFQIRKETGTIIAEEIETTAHASIKIKDNDIKLNDISNKSLDQQKIKQILKSPNEHKEPEKVATSKKTKSKSDLNLECGVGTKKASSPTSPKEPKQLVLNNGTILDQNKKSVIRLQEKNIDPKLKLSEMTNRTIETSKIQTNKELQKEPKLSPIFENVQQFNVSKDNASKPKSCASDIEKPILNLKTLKINENESSYANSKRNELDFKSKETMTSLSKISSVESKAKSNDMENILKIDDTIANYKKDKDVINDKSVDADRKSLDVKTIQQIAGTVDTNINHKPLAPPKCLASTQTTIPDSGIAENFEKTEPVFQANALNTETSKYNRKVSKTLDLKSKGMEIKVSKDAILPEKSEDMLTIKAKLNDQNGSLCFSKESDKFKAKTGELKVINQTNKVNSSKASESTELLKEICPKSRTTVSKLDALSDKQKVIQVAKVPETANDMQNKNEENINLRSAINNKTQDHSDKQQNVCKMPEIPSFENKEIGAVIPYDKTPRNLEKITSKLKVDGKAENTNLEEKDKMENCNNMKEVPSKTNIQKTLKPAENTKLQKERDSKTTKIPNTPEIISHKQETISTTEAVKAVKSKQIADPDKSNIHLNAEIKGQNLLNDKQSVACKTSETPDLKNKEIKSAIAKQTAMSKKIEVISDSKMKDHEKADLLSELKNQISGEKTYQPKEIVDPIDKAKGLITSRGKAPERVQEEKNSKTPSSISNNHKIIHEKSVISTPESMNHDGIESKSKSNFRSVTENGVHNLNKEQYPVTCKDKENNLNETSVSKQKGYSSSNSTSPDSQLGGRKNNLALEEKSDQNKKTTQSINPYDSQTKTDSEVNCTVNLQKQKSHTSTEITESKSLLTAQRAFPDKVVAQEIGVIGSKTNHIPNLKIKTPDQQNFENSKLSTSKISNISKGGKQISVDENVSKSAFQDPVPIPKTNEHDLCKTLSSNEKEEVTSRSKLASVEESKLPTLKLSAIPEKTAEKYLPVSTKQSVEITNVDVTPSIDIKSEKQDTPLLITKIPKLNETMKQNAEKSVTVTTNKDENSSHSYLISKPNLQEIGPVNKSKTGTDVPCTSGIIPIVKDKDAEMNKPSILINQNTGNNAKNVIRDNKDDPTLTLDIPEKEKRQVKPCDTAEKTLKISEDENNNVKNVAPAENTMIQNKEIVPEGAANIDSISAIKYATEKARKISLKKDYDANHIENASEKISGNELKNEISIDEPKSLKNENIAEDEELTNGCISSSTHESPKMDKTVRRRMIGLFVQPKEPTYKTIPESSSSDESNSDSNEETLSVNVNQQKKMECNVTCHQKCEKHMPNLCGVNQKLLSQVLDIVKKGKSSEHDDRGRKRTSSAGSTFSIATTCSNLSSSSEVSNLSDDLRNSSLNNPQKKLKFRKYAIDDFLFLKLLGKGSFGKVLLAELKNSSLYFAVKCLKKDVVLEDDDVESTMIERRVLALGTQHPYMCKLYCTFQTESHLCFVMEYLNGGDLMFHIQESGRFEQSRAMFYGAEVASALGFLHKRGIVYRDMKLDNVVLDEEGHIRLVDFGMCQCRIYREECQPFNFCGTPQYIAPEPPPVCMYFRDIKVDNILLDDEGHVHLVDFGMCKVGVIGTERTSTFCGTPDYIPPEIVTGQKYNQSVDWWSFGVLLYEMLTGRSPFNGTDEDELFWSICNEEPHYPRFLTKEALNILQLFLNKNPEDRLGMPSCPEGSIRQQAFFSPIDWNKLEKKQIKPPFKPRVKYASDTSNFDSNFTMDVATLTPVEMDILHSMDQEQFKGFSYTNPHITG